MSQNICGEFTQPKAPRNPPKLLKIIVQPKILQDIIWLPYAMTHLAYLFYCLSDKDDPLRSALDFVAQPTGPPLVHAAHYWRETQWWKVWRYDPWKLHLSGVSLVDGTFFSDSGAQGYEKNMFATCNCNSPLSSQLLSAGRHLEVLQFLDPTRERWHALHGGK